MLREAQFNRRHRSRLSENGALNSNFALLPLPPRFAFYMQIHQGDSSCCLGFNTHSLVRCSPCSQSPVQRFLFWIRQLIGHGAAAAAVG